MTHPEDQDDDRHGDVSRTHLRAVEADEKPAYPYPRPGDPTAVARRLLTDLFTDGDYYTLRYWRGDWYTWCTSHWKPVPDEKITGDIWLHLDQKFYVHDDDMRPWCPTPNKVSGVRQALLYLVHLPDDQDAPMWIGSINADPAEFIALDNTLLHWTTRKCYTFSPRFFNTYALPYSYDPEATCPRWENFIETTFSDDRAGAKAVQEFFGYVLTGDNSRQKGLMVIGPPGGGKGVLSNVLTAMIGGENVASTDPQSMQKDTGLWDMIGKPLAVFSDARTDGLVKAEVLGKLLRVIGGDPVNIERKYQKSWTGYLSTRFLWVSNDMPRFNDNSGAILRRWIVVRLRKAVAEADRDPALGKKLAGELPGILNWALDGLRNLNEQGAFTEPSSQAEALDHLRDSVSPITAFLEDRFEVTEDDTDVMTVTDVRSDYESWAETNGYRSMNRETFMEKINGCDAKVTAKNTAPTDGVFAGRKNRYVFGVRSKATW